MIRISTVIDKLISLRWEIMEDIFNILLPWCMLLAIIRTDLLNKQLNILYHHQQLFCCVNIRYRSQQHWVDWCGSLGSELLTQMLFIGS